MAPEAFRRSTLREVQVFMRGARWRQEQRQSLAILGAWTTAALMRRDPRKRLPALERLLPREPSPQSPEDVAFHLREWARNGARQGLKKGDPRKRLDIRIGRLKEPIDFRHPPKVLHG
jgi:hypothetical protein